MMKKSVTLVEVMVTLAIFVLLVIIIASSILSPKIITNEKRAREGLKAISRAYELYALNHNGSYNESLKNLSNQGIYNPPFLNIDFSTGTHNGYNFSCASNSTGYICQARPAVFRETGTKSFSVCNGAVLREASGETAPACP